MPQCNLCDGSCADADLEPLLEPRLRWLWEQIAQAADRRGDSALIAGSLKLKAPSSAEERAAATGLLGGRTLLGGQSRTIDLAQLTQKIRVRGPVLTPGSVTAHALRRPLASRAAKDKQQEGKIQRLKSLFVELASSVPERIFPQPEPVWAKLQRGGWVTRLASMSDADRLLQSAIAVLRALPAPGKFIDRRQLAAVATANPHALDYGSTLTTLVLALLSAAGRIRPRQSPRHSWAALGVRSDDVVGGLISLGIVPLGLTVPSAAPVTLPPRVLSTYEWPAAPFSGAWIFVTENPSVVSAAADLPQRDDTLRLLCTNGTPSDVEIASIGRLAHRGWHIAVRADFDAAGIAHVAAVLKAAPEAVPWRMGARDYLESIEQPMEERVQLADVPEIVWDAELAEVMRAHGVAAYEESLLSALLADLQRGRPPGAA